MLNGNPCPSFQTSRLQLRMLQPGDERFLASLECDIDVTRYVHSGPLSERAAAEWAQLQIEMAERRSHLHKWLVERRDDHLPIGWVELSRFRGAFDPEECRGSDDVNLGYQFARNWWNRGFATESACPILSYAFDDLQLDRVVAFTHVENIASGRVLQKLGFRQHHSRRYQDESGNPRALLLPAGE